MKTTKASTNATTYEEYLEQREKELQEEVEFWHRAWKDMRAENATLKEHVAELQAEGEELLEENKKLLLEKASLKEKNAMMRSHIDLVETYLEMLQDSITNAMTGARIGGDYKSNMEWLVETAKKYKL